MYLSILQFLLRISPWCRSSDITSLDEVVRGLLASIANVKLDECTWDQAFLPVRWGGIGVRRASSLASSAFLASIHASASLIKHVLPNADHFPDSLEVEALWLMAIWMTLSGVTPSPGQEACSQ